MSFMRFIFILVCSVYSGFVVAVDTADFEIQFKDLPFEMAIKKTFGNGSRKIAHFSDPNCTACKELQINALSKIEDATIFLFLYPVLSDKSVPIAKRIWCSNDPYKAWMDYVELDLAPVSNTNCNNPINAVLEFGKANGIYATPTLFFNDGGVVVANLDLDALETVLSEEVSDSETSDFYTNIPGPCGGENMINR